MTPRELEDKFYGLATTVMSRVRAGQIADLVRRLETVPDMAELAALLAAER